MVLIMTRCPKITCYSEWATENSINTTDALLGSSIFLSLVLLISKVYLLAFILIKSKYHRNINRRGKQGVHTGSKSERLYLPYSA